MTDIDNYLNDGANYQAQMVLCYLRGNQYGIREMCYLKGEDFHFSLNHLIVGRFENCREQGYVFGVKVRDFHELDDKWMVVEHRSSDSLKVRHFRAMCVNTPSFDVCYGDKYLVEEKWFECDDVVKASEYILDGMKRAVNEFKDGQIFKKIVEKHEEKFGNKGK